MDSLAGAMARILVVGTVVSSVAVLGLGAVLRVAAARLRRQPTSPARRRDAFLFGSLLLVELACLAWAAFVEPRWLEVTHLTLPTQQLAPGQRLRILHFTDTHLQGGDPFVEALPLRVAELEPDLIVFTGDAATTERDLADFNALLRRLPARFGRYVVRGNHEAAHFPASGIFGDAAVELTGAPVEVPGTPLTLCGAPYLGEERLVRCLTERRRGLRVAVYHTPDLVERVAPVAPELYLAGHTHGGQIRLPLYGALITLSAFDKKYEAGLYQVGETALYVNRGLGMEPRPAPQLRFLCRPEIAVIDLVGAR